MGFDDNSPYSDPLNHRPSHLKSWSFLFVIFLLLLSVGCQIKPIHPDSVPDSRYDTALAQEGLGPLLNTLTRSLVRINYIATYTVYTIPSQSRITRNMSDKLSVITATSSTNIENETSSGTGILLSSTRDRVLILTCAHIGNYPDTVFSYRTLSNQTENIYLDALAIKIKEKYYTSDLKGINEITTLTVDTKKDLMLLRSTRNPVEYPEPPITLPFGHSEYLQWGSRVYVLGFPMGNLMVTEGLVSVPKNNSTLLLTDALFNPGFSGGMIVAIRDGLPNLEWIGIAKSVSAQSTIFLKPDPAVYTTENDPSHPYLGTPYITTHQDINYGVTYAIPVETIRRFLSQNKETIHSEGYYLSPSRLND